MLWGFFGFLLVFSAFRSLRRLRGLREQRSRNNWSLPSETRKPADDFHDQIWLPLCDRIAAVAGKTLSRALSAKERKAIWRMRSLLALETVGKEIEMSTDPQAVAVLLATLPPGMDRPDPTGWCGK